MTATSPLHSSGPAQEPSLQECYANTDLQWRLGTIPDEWAVRGVFFNMLDDRAGELDPATQRAYRDYFRIHRFSPFRFYPVKDYLTRIVLVSQIHFGARNIYQGIFEIQRHAFSTWRGTLIGRAAFAVLGRNLDAVLAGTERAYMGKTATNYTDLHVVHENASTVRVRFRSEPVYIEHAMRGALAGVIDACGIDADVEADLTGPFDGDVVIRVH